jgi:hypothetical protein
MLSLLVPYAGMQSLALPHARLPACQPSCLQDVTTHIPSDHISNTNPMLAPPPSLPGAPPEAELLELQAKLAFHGRRLFRHEVSLVVVQAGCETSAGSTCMPVGQAVRFRTLAAPGLGNWQPCLAVGRPSAVSTQLPPPCPPPAQVAATAWRLQFAEHWQREQGGKAGDELRLAASHLISMLGDEDEIRWRRRGVHGLVRMRACPAPLLPAELLSGGCCWMLSRACTVLLAQSPSAPAPAPLCTFPLPRAGPG